jgi:hypothetical protein
MESNIPQGPNLPSRRTVFPSWIRPKPTTDDTAPGIPRNQRLPYPLAQNETWGANKSIPKIDHITPGYPNTPAPPRQNPSPRNDNKNTS